VSWFIIDVDCDRLDQIHIVFNIIFIAFVVLLISSLQSITQISE